MDFQPSNRPTYEAVFFFLGRYKLLFGAILFVTLASAVVESLSVVAFFPMFSTLMSVSSENATGMLGLIMNLANALPIENPIVAASVLLTVTFGLKTMFSLLRETILAYAGAKVFYSVKKEIVERYAGAQYQFILDNKQGTLIYNSLDAPGAVISFLLSGAGMVMSLLKIVTVTAVLVTILPWATLAAAILGLLYYGLVHYLSKKISFRLGLRATELAAAQVVTVNEFLNGFRQILTFNTSSWWTNQFDRQNKRYCEIQAQAAVSVALPRPLMELAVIVLMLSIILVTWLSNPGSVSESLPKVGVFAVALAQLLAPITSIGAMRMGIMGALPNLDRVHYAMTGPIPMRKDGDAVVESFDKAIVFDKVSFGYGGRDVLFDGLDMSFEKGKVTAIVGPSGAGKTTIINLILGLFEPTDGNILIDGVPLQSLKQSTWLAKIGFVSQDLFTYHSTILENILLGRDEHSSETVIDASKIANAHEFIIEHPQGYDTIVGDRGLTLSGGQQQRLAIARAVLDAPEILIFDEATSSLDNISERLVQQAISNVSVNRTVIVIAHRLSTVQQADKIIVVRDGRVVEEGDHEELISKRGLYSRMASTTG